MERMKDGDIISFNGAVYKYCTGGTCLQCSLCNTRLCGHLKCFNGEHFEMLKGAEVIEIPSEEEVCDEAAIRYPSTWNGKTNSEGGYEIPQGFSAFIKAIEWVKSKIVK